MSLALGTRVGPYEITGQIGAGGMGEVYRATDTHLKRTVAIKVLPEAVATDGERLARFQREAEVLARLNHPNIAAIHGLERGDGQTALVMELVEGPTLADRIAQGPISVAESLEIAKQIAEAVEAAHEQGIVHRDLKPANIKLRPDGAVKVLDFGLAKALSTDIGLPSAIAVTNSPTLTSPVGMTGVGIILGTAPYMAPEQAKGRAVDARADGTVKVLDFGLAKAMDPVGSAPNVSQPPTITTPAMMTGGGVILGTAAYMSPEQAKGRPADKRSDIWAFGCILFEMLTGSRPFGGEDIGETLAEVIKGDPDWNALPATTPPEIHRLLRQCLTKDRRQRLQAIGDARIVLEAPAHDEHAAVTRVKGSPRSQLGWFVAGVFGLMVAVLAFLFMRQQVPAERTLRYTIPPPDNSVVHSFAISPDGHYVVLAARVGARQQLWLRPLDGLTTQPLATTDDATYPFWSPDSRSIAFFAQGKLKKISVGGGPAQPLCDAVDTRGGSWNRDNVIVFSQAGQGDRGIQRVSAAGGIPVDVLPKGVFRYPVFLPDGQRFLYTDIRPSDTSGIHVASLDGTSDRRILPDASAAVFARSSTDSRAGHLLFVRDDILMALPFDAETAQASGDPFPVTEGVGRSILNAGYAPFAVSESGVLSYWTGPVDGPNKMAWFDRGGTLLGSIAPAGQAYAPAISPTEKAVAFARRRIGGADIWVWEATRSNETRLTTTGGTNTAPAWSPAGNRIGFTQARVVEQQSSLRAKAVNGSGPEEVFLTLPGLLTMLDQWSRDGRYLVYHRNDPTTKQDVWVLPLTEREADRKLVPFLQSNFNELYGQLSPDSRWMAYTDDGGFGEICVRAETLLRAGRSDSAV